jgi:hypothetical protein
MGASDLESATPRARITAVSNNKLRPPWIHTPATRNVAKRARLAAIQRKRLELERQQRLATLANDARKAR